MCNRLNKLKNWFLTFKIKIVMKKCVLLLGFLIALFTVPMAAQEEVIVEPGAPGVLNQAISNPANQGKILVLRRGFPYLSTGEIENTGFALHIKAEAGDGPRPIIIFSPPAGGAAVDQIFRARANLTLEGLHLTNRDLLGGVTERIVRTGADSISVRMLDCLVDDSGQTAFRLDGKLNRIYATNTVFSRMGVPSNPDNGRVIDDRGNDVDTIWIENCVIYNVTSRVIRDGGGKINYVHFNQNTVANIGQRGFEWGEVEEFNFTNNIVANGGFLGRQFSLDPTENDIERHVINMDSTGSGNEKWVIRNNNFYRNADVVAATPAQQADGDTIQQQPYFNAKAMGAIMAGGWESTNIEEELDFTNPPTFSFDFIAKHHAGEGSMANAWDHSGLTPNAIYSAIGSMTPRYSESHDFGYPTSAASYTAGTEGQPLGSDLFDFTTSTKDLFVENNILYYPNPVKDQLFIQNLKAELIAGIRVFNLQGQLIHNQRVNNDYVILQTANWNAGMYVLSVVDKRGNVSARKFVKK